MFISKQLWPLEDLSRTNLFLSLVLLEDGHAPNVYLIPSSVWLEPNALFCSRDYGNEGQKSLPEWGINLSAKNMPLLAQYDLVSQAAKIKALNNKPSTEVSIRLQ